MGSARVRFESIDNSTQRQAQGLARKLHAAGGKRVTVQMEGQLAELFERIASVIAEVDGLAYGGLAAELLAGAGRPGARDFPAVGECGAWMTGVCRSHMWARTAAAILKTSLRLKVQEEKQAEALRELGEGIDDLDFRPPRS